jgi:hypothetical protein
VTGDGFFCEAPEHVGDRRIRHRENQFTKRVTYVRTDGRQRLHEKVLPEGRRCRNCVERENASPFYQEQLL